MSFEPKIVGFLCNWCSYCAADKAGRSRRAIPHNLSIVRVMCSGRVDPEFMLAAFREGADGILVLGCHLGDCHYKEGNHKALRRHHLLRRTLADLGVEPERLHLEWVSASEAEKFVKVTNEFVETVRRLGPLRLEPALAGPGRGGRAEPHAHPMEGGE